MTLRFETQTPVSPPDPLRTDVGCFVGFVQRRPSAVPAEIAGWLRERGWLRPPHGTALAPLVGQPLDPQVTLDEHSRLLHVTIDGVRQAVRLEPGEHAAADLAQQIDAQLLGGRVSLDEQRRLTFRAAEAVSLEVRPHVALGFPVPARVVHPLRDVPVPVESWDAFAGLFLAEQRDLDGRGTVGSTYVGAAVRSYFEQGGRKCFVVSVGPPEPLVTFEQRHDAARIAARVGQLIPGFSAAAGARVAASAADPGSWSGLGHLLGLDEVSFVCLPDLPDIVGCQTARPELPDPPPAEPVWTECSPPGAAVQEQSLAGLSAPRCDDLGYRYWAQTVGMAAEFLSQQRREVQLIAAVPLPAPELPLEANLLEYLIHGDVNLRRRIFDGPLAHSPQQSGAAEGDLLPWRGIASAFVQLVWPWLRTGGAGRLPEGLENPEGVLMGMLAGNALTRGTFRHAGRVVPAGVAGLTPLLSAGQIQRPLDDDPGAVGGGHTLADRVSLFAPTPDGLRLISDVTTSRSPSHRAASLSRLTGAILRAARRLGETIVFDVNGQVLWDAVRNQMAALLRQFQRAGALGAAAGPAFRVRCDRSTISQNDLDNGRVVAEVQFSPTSPIGELVIVLALDPGGQVSLTTARQAHEEAA